MTWADEMIAGHRPRGESLAWCYDNPPVPVPTGMGVVDDMLGGGIWPGLNVIGGQSSCGKTAFLAQVAQSVARAGRDVLYVSTETPNETIRFRMIASARAELVDASAVAPEDPHDLRGVRDPQELRERQHRCLVPWGKISQWRAQFEPPADRLSSAEGDDGDGLYMDDDGTLKPASHWRGLDPMARAISDWQEEHDDRVVVTTLLEDAETLPDVLDEECARREEAGDEYPVAFVDYLQLMPPPKEASSSAVELTDYQRITKIVTSLQAVCLAHPGLVVVLASSLNREGERALLSNNPPDLTWFTGSGTIGYSAETATVMTLPRGTAGPRRLTCVKVRQAAAWTGCEMPVDLEHNYFRHRQGRRLSEDELRGRGDPPLAPGATPRDAGGRRDLPF